MSTVDWSVLPLLPLKSILQHLPVADALAATSTCRHWRMALLLYEGHRDTLKLSALDLNKSIFLTRVFRKHVRRLHVHLDNQHEDLEQYLQVIIPRFYDTALLNEIVFIGSTYLNNKNNSSVIKLKRPMADSLIHAHKHTLQHLALIGCEFDTYSDIRCEEKNDVTTKRISFLNPHLGPYGIKGCNMKNAVFSSLQQLCLDYSSIEPELIENMSHLPLLSRLALTLTDRKGRQYERLDWSLLEKRYTNPLEVSLTIMELPVERFDDLIKDVLVESLPLVAIQVLFCKTLHEPLLVHIMSNYTSTLRQLEWTDAPCESVYDSTYVGSEMGFDSGAINPFILLCWKCMQLQSLIINGYWFKQYDLIGMIRLREATLQRLQIPCVCSPHGNTRPLSPVLHSQRLTVPDATFVQQMNQHLQFKWNPVKKWNNLHPALTPKSTKEMRTEYLLTKTLETFGVT